MVLELAGQMARRDVESNVEALLASDGHGTRPMAAAAAYNDKPLDDKTPLLRAQETVSSSVMRLLHLVGDEETVWVIFSVG